MVPPLGKRIPPFDHGYLQMEQRRGQNIFYSLSRLEENQGRLEERGTRGPVLFLSLFCKSAISI